MYFQTLELNLALVYFTCRANSDAVASHHDKSATCQCVRIQVYEFRHSPSLFCQPHVNESDDARVRQSLNVHQLSKVFVLSNQYAAFLNRNCQYFLIQRTRRHVQGGSHVVSQVGQYSPHSAR